MQDKCEKKDCNEPRTCFHYCDKHHQEICLSGYPTLQEFLAAQQSVQLTGGTLPDFQALFDPEVLSGLEAESTPPTSN